MPIKRVSRWRIYREAKAKREGRLLRFAPCRPKKHASNAARQAAYRKRKRDRERLDIFAD